MVWARLDDRRHEHEKVLILSELGSELEALAAIGLLDHAMTWASANTKRGQPDHGMVPNSFWRKHAPKHWRRLTSMLVSAVTEDGGSGFLIEHPRGFQIYNFAAYGPKRDPEEAAKSGAKGAAARLAKAEAEASYSSDLAQADSGSSSNGAGSYSSETAQANFSSHAPAPTRSRPPARDSHTRTRTTTRSGSSVVETPAVERGRDATEPGVLPEIAKARRRAAGAHGVADVEGWSADECARIANTAAVKFAGGPAGPDDHAEARQRLVVLAALPDTRGPQRLLDPAGWATAGAERERMAVALARRQADAGALAEQRQREAEAETERQQRQRRVTTISQADPEHWVTLRQLARAELEAEDATPLGPVVDLRALQIHDRQTADQ